MLVLGSAALFAWGGYAFFVIATPRFGSTNLGATCIRVSRGVPPGFSRAVGPIGGFMRNDACIFSPGYWPWVVLSVTIGAIVGAFIALGIMTLFRVGSGPLSRGHAVAPPIT